MPRFTKPSWGRQHLIKNIKKLDAIYDIIKMHNIDLGLHIDKKKITIDMYKVALMVYFDWKIPALYFSAVTELVKNLHFFKRFPDERHSPLHELLTKAEGKRLGKMLSKLLVKYYNEKNGRFAELMKVSFMSGILFSDIGKGEYTLMAFKFTIKKWVRLLKFYIEKNYQVPFNDIAGIAETLDENGNVDLTHMKSSWFHY